MAFPQFLGILFGILTAYYLVVILFDLAKNSTKKAAAVSGSEHAVTFDTPEETQIVKDDFVESPDVSIGKPTLDNEKKKTVDDKPSEQVRINEGSPHVDLKLETVCPEEYELTAEELMKSVTF